MILKKLFQIREEGDAEKPFLEHLEDLRWTLIKCAIVLAASMIGAFFFRIPLTRIIQRPLELAAPQAAAAIQSLAPADSITISFQLAFYAGIVIAFPFILYFIIEFILPALNQKERRLLLPGIAIATGLFLAGVFFSYYIVLPMTLAFFYSDAQSLGWTPSWTVKDYFSFVTQFAIAFGLCFELPVVVMALVKLGLLTAKTLRSSRSYAVVAICFLAAVITPTTDILTLVLMSGPMLALYEGCIWLAVFLEKKRNKLKGRNS